MAEPELVKVIFYLERDEDDYPPFEVESLGGIRTCEGIRIDNIPFYARGISCGDVVAVSIAPDGALECGSVVKRGGHSTYRVFLLKKHEEDPEHTIQELQAMGLGVEGDLGRLLAIDVPPEVSTKEVQRYLKEGMTSGRWDVEEGFTAASEDDA